jgi:hypothetical protein
MYTNKLILIIHAALISFLGVFVIDYFSHLLFSNPMETIGYFWVKCFFYFIFSTIFLLVFDLQIRETTKVVVAGFTIALLWGGYYNVFPLIFDYYPYGIALNGLTFMGMGIFGTGLAFGAVHAVAFVGGYYFGKLILE